MSSGPDSLHNALSALFYDVDATLAQLAHVPRPQSKQGRLSNPAAGVRDVEQPARATVADLRHLVAMSPSGRRTFEGLTFVVGELAVKDSGASPYAPRHIAPYLFLEVAAPKRFSPNHVELVRVEALRAPFLSGSSSSRIKGPKHRAPSAAEKEAVRNVLASVKELFAPGERRGLQKAVDLRGTAPDGNVRVRSGRPLTL